MSEGGESVSVNVIAPTSQATDDDEVKEKPKPPQEESPQEAAPSEPAQPPVEVEETTIFEQTTVEATLEELPTIEEATARVQIAYDAGGVKEIVFEFSQNQTLLVEVAKDYALKVFQIGGDPRQDPFYQAIILALGEIRQMNGQPGAEFDPLKAS